MAAQEEALVIGPQKSCQDANGLPPSHLARPLLTDFFPAYFQAWGTRKDGEEQIQAVSGDTVPPQLHTHPDYHVQLRSLLEQAAFPRLLLDCSLPLSITHREHLLTTRQRRDFGYPLSQPDERVQPSLDIRGGDEIPPHMSLGYTDYKLYHTLQSASHVSVSMVYIFRSRASSKDTFAFKFSASPSLKFSFDRPVSAPDPSNRSYKRPRALSDVDGAGNEGRKKRRLRLHLITSRLSRPFSQPATNIVNRGMKKIPVWGAKSKVPVLSKTMMRKAAIMNRVRRCMDTARDDIRMEQEEKKEMLSFQEIVIKKPRHLDVPLPPSPLGLSAYDAFDLEDEEASEDLYGDDIGLEPLIYSDFNFMNPTGERNDDEALDDYLDALDGICPRDLPDTPPPAPPDVVEVLREDQQREGLFVQIRD